MRIVSYNMDRGGGPAQWRWLTTEPFDLVLVQEAADPRPSDPARWRWRERIGWGTGVWCRSGEIGQALDVPTFSGEVVAVVVRLHALPAGPTELLAISFHNPLYHPAAPATILRLLENLSPPSGIPIVLGGDFNVASLGCRQPGEALATTRAERSMLAALREQWGLMPFWPTAHPGQPLPQTHRWSGNRSTPYHCDGVFIPASWAAEELSCTVIDQPEAPLFANGNYLGDHHPVIVELAARHP